MAVDPFLVEAQWKAKGLPLRTNAEKLKIKKTGVSEALHAYATAAALPVGRAAAKKTRLQEAKAAVVKCKNDHRRNTAFVAYADNVEKGVTREVARLNGVIAALTLEHVMGNPAEFDAFLEFARSRHCEENLEFLHDAGAGMSAPNLIAKYVREGAPKFLNLDDGDRGNWVGAPNNANFKKAAVDFITGLITNDTMAKYRTALKIELT